MTSNISNISNKESNAWELVLHGDHIHTIEFVLNVVSSVSFDLLTVFTNPIVEQAITMFQVIPSCSRRQVFDTIMIVSKQGRGRLLKGEKNALSEVKDQSKQWQHHSLDAIYLLIFFLVFTNFERKGSESNT